MSTHSDQNISVSSWLTHLPSPPISSADKTPVSPPFEPPLPPISTPVQSYKRKGDQLGDITDVQPPRLTRRALREFEATMAPNGQKDQTQGSSQTPTHSAKSSTRKERSNLHHVTRWLQEHGMHYNDLEAWNVRCPAFRDKVLAPFTDDRNSTMQPSSHAKCNDTLNETRYSNEATFHKEMVPLILKDQHTVMTHKRDLKGQMMTVVKSYADNNGLRSQEKPYLAKGFVPGKDDAMKAVGITEPNPDTVYGKLQPEFIKPGTQGPSDIKVIKSLGCTVDWVFFIFEAKPSQTAVPPARNQAQRDCGAVLKSLLKLKEYVEGRGYKEKAGAVEDFWVFSFCWNPDYANILVHWVEILEDGTEIFHATKLRQKFLDEEQGQADLRACGHNIFDHGLYTHVPAMEKLWAKAVKAGKPFDKDFDLYA